MKPKKKKESNHNIKVRMSIIHEYSYVQVNDNKVMMVLLVNSLKPLPHFLYCYHRHVVNTLPYCMLVSQAIIYDVDENGMKVNVQIVKSA